MVLELSDRTTSRFTVANAILVTALLHLVRFGYDFGTSDQDEFVPAVLRALDPALFSSDWLVMWQSAGFTIRTPTILLLSGLGAVFSVQGAVLVLYVASFGLIALAAIRLVQLVTNSAASLFIAPILMLVATPRFTLGGNDLTHALFVPSMLAWGLALHGLVTLLERRYAVAGILFGLATVFQPLVGIQVAGLSAVAIAMATATIPRAEAAAAASGPSVTAATLRSLFVVAGVAIAIASPVLAFIIRTQLDGSGAVPPPREFDLLVNIRAPHHFLPSAFPSESFLRFGVLALAGLSATLLSPVLRPFRRFLISLYIATAIACTIYVIGVDFLKLLPVAKLQVMKSTVLIKAFACIAVGASVGSRIAARTKSRGGRTNAFGRIASSPSSTLVLGGLLLVAIAAAPHVPALGQRFALLERHDSPWAALHAWARNDTAPDDLFAVPPSNADMRSWGRRAIAANFKAFAFQADAMAEWNARLVAFSNNPDIASHFVPGDELDASYEAMDTSDLLGLANEYGVDHVVRRTRAAPADSVSGSRIRLMKTFTGSRDRVSDSLFVYTALR